MSAIGVTALRSRLGAAVAAVAVVALAASGWGTMGKDGRRWTLLGSRVRT